MATVFLATQISLDRKVAIKILRTENDDDPERTERRFLREGRILAKITHRNVCGIYDIAKVGNVAYIAMEFLDGGTLVDRQRDGIAVGESIAIVVQVASALQEAHNQGIVHRDLKPANVMMRGGKVPVLTDFGIARELASHQTRITTENMIVGTPVYMSPEQVTGGEIDVRSDIYSLGIMFYELLVGKAPYLGDNPIQVCMQHLTSPVPVLPAELDEINPVLARMLAKKAEDRFATMAEFTHALRDVFVHSMQLRSKAELAPNQPWTEQLRQMGFSFDTMRDGELNAKLRQQQAALNANRAADRPVAPLSGAAAETQSGQAGQAASAYSYRKPQPSKSKWLAIAAAAVLGIGGISYFALRDSSGGKAGRYQLQGMAATFDEQIARDALFEPIDDNAAQTIADMRDVSGKSAITKARIEKLLEVVNTKLAALIAAEKFDDAQTLYTLALNAELFTQKQAEELQLRISNSRSLIANKALIEAQMAALAAALKQNSTPAELFSELEALRKLVTEDDERLVTTERNVGVKVLGQYAIALQNDDLDGAQVILAAMLEKLPRFPDLARYQTELRERQAKVGVEVRMTRLRSLLGAKSLTLDSITLAATGISALAQSNPSDELAALKVQLLTMTNAAALQSLEQKNDIKSAQAIISALGEFARDDAVRPARMAILAAVDAAQFSERSGTVVIDTAPYSKILSITDANGKSIPIPAPGVTPISLVLLEGQYRVELTNALGESKNVQVSVARKATTESAHILYSSKSDDYLREAGY